SQLIPAAAVGIVKVKKSAEQPSHKEPLKIAIDNINITNTSIRWFDEQKKPTMIVKNLELHAKNISLLNPFSITVTFDFANPKIAGNVKLKTMMAANLSSQIYAFKNFDVNIDTDKLPLHVTGDFTADLKRETFQWSPLQGNIDQLHFSGKMSGTEIKAAPKFIGKVNVAPTDLRDLLKKLDYNVQNLQTLNPVSGDFDITFGEKPLTVTGKLKVGTLEFQHITLKNIILPTFYQAGTLTFSPFNADFYQGTMDGTATFALNDQKIGLVLQLQNFAVNELLKDLVAEKSKIKFSGKGFLNVSLKTQGHSTDNKIKNLNGQGKLRIEQGVLQGIDIPNLINSAYAFIKKTPLSSSNTGQTPFNELSGTFTIQNGIVSNQDLKMTATQFSTTGQGNIDLPRNNIHYQLKTIVNKATLQDKDSLLNLYGVAIPILISGDLQNPKIGLDASEVGKILAEMQAKKVEVHIKDKLKGKKASDIINSLFGH
ncbi:MAG TPA: AsmA family protein, partial [Gammaproteobacteria bacterium]|nr:AsmA family protein [Gammaproteobacteria bacterium]